MPENKPLISIIIPLYNRENYIVETLASVKEQTFKNWECIIVDDHSSDNSYTVTQNYIKDDNRFKLLYRSPNYKSGGNGARNEGFLKSKGEFIIFLDSDDIISGNKLDTHYNAFISVQNIDISFSDWVKFNGGEVISIKHDFLDSTIYSAVEILHFYAHKNSFIQTAAYCIRKEFLVKSGLFLEALKVNQDGEFFIRLLLHKPLLHYTKSSFVKWRMDTNNKSSHETNELKFKHRVASYKLIEQYGIIYSEPLIFSIVENAKAFMFNSYSIKCPAIISENKFFFRNEIKKSKKNKNLFNRIYRKFLK